MLQTLRNAWKIPDLRRRLLFTLFMLILFRFGAHIPVPFLSSEAMTNFLGTGTDLFSLFDVFTGGAFSNATVMALGVSPYINASIIIQLLAVAIPALEKLSKQGVEGRKKLNKITRYLGIALAFVQGAGLYVTLLNMRADGLDAIVTPEGISSVLVFFVIVLTFTAGTAFMVWMGELITEKGIGNGVSLLIFAGIVSRIPTAAYSVYNQYVSGGATVQGILMVLGIVVVAVAAIAFVVYFSEAERRIPIQYAKRVVGRKMYGGQSTNIPIKIAAGGVMPIIFASSIMAFPATIVRLVSGGNMPTSGVGYYILGCLSAGYASQWWTSLVYAILYFLLIIFFTYFYSTIQFNPIEIANNVKKSGGFIPGIRPGKPTSDYISKISSRLNLIGAMFLGIIAVLPVVLGAIFNISGLQIGGTSLLIVEGVALESVRQIESQMVMRHYKGFLN
ncbi:MAG: preprotein translocase subunit SecY [Firmicutes bacterium]|nr:preprotein translocase subunit SecY [Bacillota bacterium]